MSEVSVNEKGLRRTRSYVLRTTRMTQGQVRAIEELYPRFGLAYAGGEVAERLTVDDAFSRDGPSQRYAILDIGFGMGHQFVAYAAAHPEHDLVGVEVHKPGIGRVLREIELHELQNVRLIRHDAREVVERLFAPAQFDEVRILFPDPWPKKRHHKRRLVTRSFAELLAKALKPHGRLCLATDWEDYALQMLDEITRVPELSNTAERFATPPEWRAETAFERKGRARGHEIFDLVFERG